MTEDQLEQEVLRCVRLATRDTELILHRMAAAQSLTIFGRWCWWSADEICIHSERNRI